LSSSKISLRVKIPHLYNDCCLYKLKYQEKKSCCQPRYNQGKIGRHDPAEHSRQIKKNWSKVRDRNFILTLFVVGVHTLIANPTHATTADSVNVQLQRQQKSYQRECSSSQDRKECLRRHWRECSAGLLVPTNSEPIVSAFVLTITTPTILHPFPTINLQLKLSTRFDEKRRAPVLYRHEKIRKKDDAH
jgi:hypothetical protein